MHSSKVSRGPSAVLGSDQLVFPAPFTLATTLQSKTHVVPSSSKQPVSSGSYLIHKSTPCRVAQVIFVCPSCSPWLSHLKMGGGAVMAKQCQIFPALVCHQSELIFLQSYELSSRANTCSLGFPTANDLPGPGELGPKCLTIQPLHLVPLSVKFTTQCLLQGVIKQLLGFLPSQH